jgi:hypothetical protein
MIKRARNATAILFSLVTVINFAILFYRDKFIYHKYATPSSLYSTDTLKWKKLVYDYPKKELADARIMLESLADLKNKPETAKILEIGKLLYQRFHDRRGRPLPFTASAPPLGQFKILSASDSMTLWCGDFAAMFVFFCWAEGIPCRFIEIINPGDHHVLNECYLRESKEWVLVDVTTNHLLLFNKNRNRFENLLNVRDALSDSLQSFQVDSNEIVTKPFVRNFYDRYFGNGNPIYYYYRINNFEVYKEGEKIKRYFLPVAWYEELNNAHATNFWFYVKEFFLLMWLISFAVLTKGIIRSKSRSKSVSS